VRAAHPSDQASPADQLSPGSHLPSAYDIAPLAAAIDVELLGSQLTEVILDEVYSHVIDPEILREPLGKALTEKLDSLAKLVAGTITLDDIHAPAALAFAAEVGRQGVAEQTLERSYRVGIQALWDWWMSVAERHCAETGDPVVDVLRASIPMLFGFVDRMLFISLAAYHKAVSERHQSLEYRRARLVEQLLDGTLSDPSVDVERFIGYALADHHVAGVLDLGDQAADRQLTSDFKRATHAAAVLVMDCGAAPTEFWLGFRTPVTQAVRTVIESVAGSARRRIALGTAEPGLLGFRASMDAARDAARIQAMLSDNAPHVLWAEDVGIEMLALRDPAGTRAIVNNVLGPSLELGLLTPRVRETLEAWLVTGSYVGAAAVLGVHEQTVRQRLHRLEGTLGRYLNDRRTELHVALRLSLLTPPPGPGSTRRP
jgi:DNA-binding PucR family transcriptional regulator